MLEGLLVDLVPYGTQFEAQEHDWRNSEANFFWTMGNVEFFSAAALKRHREERHTRQNHRSRSRVGFGIQTKDGIPLGLIAVQWIQGHARQGTLSAVIGEPGYWGGGYGTDALLLLVDYAFDWLDLRRVWLGTMDLNPRVKRQMEKVGFTLEVCYRQDIWVDGQWVDRLVYGLLREEWPGRAALVKRLGLTAR